MMIVTKDTNLNVDITGVELHSYEEALAIGRKVLSAQKELDAIIGSCLEYVKVYESHRYEEYLLALNIKQNRANVLIAHSKLVKVAEASNRSVPKEASKSRYLKGKTPEEKLDHYERVQKETGKSEPTRSEIRSLSAPGHKDKDITKDYNSKKKAEVTPERKQERLREEAHENSHIMSLEEEVHKAVRVYIEAIQKEYDRLGVNNVGTKYEVYPNYYFQEVIGTVLYSGEISPA